MFCYFSFMKIFGHICVIAILLLGFSSASANDESQILSNDSLRSMDIIPLVDLTIELSATVDLIDRNAVQLQGDTATRNERYNQVLDQGKGLKQVAEYLMNKVVNKNLLQLEYNRLIAYEDKVEGVLGSLDEDIIKFTEDIDRVNKKKRKWDKTIAYYKSVDLSEGLNRVVAIRSKLDSVGMALNVGLNKYLSKQDVFLAEKSQVAELVKSLSDLQNNYLYNLLEPSEPVIWKGSSNQDSTDSTIVDESFVYSVLGLNSWSNQLKGFVDENPSNTRGHVLFSVVILVLLFSFKNAVKEINIEPEQQRVIATLFSMPLLSGLLVSVIMVFIFYPVIPLGLRPILLLAVLFPTLFLGIRIVEQYLRIPLIIILVIYLLDQMIVIYGDGSVFYRILMMLEALGGMAAMYFGYKNRLQKTRNKVWEVALSLTPLLGALFAVSFVLNVFGYVRLANVITTVISYGFLMALVLVILYKTSIGLLHMLIFHSVLTRVNVIANYGSLLYKRLLQAVGVLLVYMWFVGFLRKSMLSQSVSQFWESFYTTEFVYGALSISVQAITEFFLVLAGSVIIANTIRAILQEDLLIRLNLKRGVPKAIAMITKYTLLVIGFFLAISSMGVDIDKLGFLAGGLGVGIGFGLQNIVGNFISGLILIFERPIHEGDVIVAGETEGEVKEIGLRSCTVRSWDGAEVIMPNQEFITGKVTNWTLSDANRRKELLIKTKLSANPNEVVENIAAAIEKRGDVLKNPAPMVLYQGYSEYSHDFRVLFWLDRNLLAASSEVALAIYERLTDMGIANPIPIREIREQKKAE